MAMPDGARRRISGQVASYGDGRVCAARGCLTQLSRYNAHALCAEHDRTARRDLDEQRAGTASR